MIKVDGLCGCLNRYEGKDRITYSVDVFVVGCRTPLTINMCKDDFDKISEGDFRSFSVSYRETKFGSRFELIKDLDLAVEKICKK